MAVATRGNPNRVRPETRRFRCFAGLRIPTRISRSRARARVEPVDLRNPRRDGGFRRPERLVDSASLCAMDSGANLPPDPNARAGFHAYPLPAAWPRFPILAKLRRAPCDAILTGADRGGGTHRPATHAKPPRVRAARPADPASQNRIPHADFRDTAQGTAGACGRGGYTDEPGPVEPAGGVVCRRRRERQDYRAGVSKRRRHRFRIVAPPGPADESRGAPGFGMFDQRGRLRGWLSPIQRIRGNVPANFWNHSEGMGLSSRETGLKSKKKPR